MGIELIYESIYSALALMDSQLQIWTTLTFALIVAVHIGKERIDRSIFRLGLSLYGFYAAILILRNVAATFQILHYQDLLVERGLEPWPVPWIVGVMIGVGTFLLLVGGSLATLWFVHASRRVSLRQRQESAAVAS
jgi:hypothetical protein